MPILLKLLSYDTRGYFLAVGNRLMSTRLLIVVVALVVLPRNALSVFLEAMRDFAQVLSASTDPGKSMAALLIFQLLTVFLYTRQKNFLSSPFNGSYASTLPIGPLSLAVEKFVFFSFVNLGPVVILGIGAAALGRELSVDGLFRLVFVYISSILLIIMIHEKFNGAILSLAVADFLYYLSPDVVATLAATISVVLVAIDLFRPPANRLFRLNGSKLRTAVGALLPRIPITGTISHRLMILLNMHSNFFVFMLLAFLLVGLYLDQLSQNFAKSLLGMFAVWVGFVSFFSSLILDRLAAAHAPFSPFMATIEGPGSTSKSDVIFVQLFCSVIACAGAVVVTIQKHPSIAGLLGVLITAPLLVGVQMRMMGGGNLHRYSWCFSLSAGYAVIFFLVG